MLAPYLRLTSSPNGLVPLKFLNRHALVAGATGSGKTVTLMRFAEECGARGIPVILTDVKGDAARLAETPRSVLPVQVVRSDERQISLRDLGADVLSLMLDSSPAQHAALWGLIEKRGVVSLADLRRAVENAPIADMTTGTKQALMRYAAPLEESVDLFGDREKPLYSLLESNAVTIFDVSALVENTAIYGAAMTRLLRYAYEGFPEVGDADRPAFVLIIDEAHALFRRMNAAMLEEFARTMRLIRSRGVAVVFATQDPTDIPVEVSQHLATRVLHAMRPGDTRLRAYLSSLYRDASLTPDALFELSPGEAFIGTVDRDGRATRMTRDRILKPAVDLRAPLAARMPMTPILPAEDVRGKAMRGTARREFGRLRPPTLAEARAELAEASRATSRARSVKTASGLALVTLALITAAALVRPLPTDPLTIWTMVRGSVLFLLIAAAMVSATLSVAMCGVVFSIWRSGR